MLDMGDSDEEIDESWATDYKNMNKEYKIFYMENVNAINISSIYINKNNEIQGITSDKKRLSKSNYFTKNEIIEFIQYKINGFNCKIKNISIFKYNITIEPENVEYFLKCDNIFNYLMPVKQIKDIYFEKTISFFQDLNEIIILFYVN